MVDLAAVTDSGQVPSAVADALRAQGGPVLLVLDNCEHVVEAIALLSAGILRSSSGVRILAITREPMRIEGERVRRLAPLESPAASAPLTAAEALRFAAVELFAQSAAAAMGGFELTDADAPIVAEICRKIDGLRLAIDFAASRVEALGVRGSHPNSMIGWGC